MSFPTELSNILPGVTEIIAAHLNNLEVKMGIDNSAVPTSLDYLLKNPASIDPGHKHSKLWAADGSPEAVTLDAAGVATFAGIPVGPGSNPTTDNQLARKAYVDLMLPLAGGTMAGNIAMGAHKFTGLAAASGAGEAVRYDEWIAALSPGHKHTKLYQADGSAEALTVNTAGLVGVGTATPYTDLGRSITVNGTTYSNFSLQVGGTAIGYFAAYSGGILQAALGNRFINFSTNGAERVKIDGDGKILINTSSGGYLLTCNGEPGANGYTAWTNYSDIRLKQDIKPLGGDILARVLQLTPVTFAYNDKNPWGEKPGARTLYGFIAQELQELFPDMVGETQGTDGEKYLTTNLSNLTLYLVQAIKEQQAQIVALQAKLN